MNALGLNGTRLLWKWNRRRASLGETGLRGEILWRSARTPHKMCPGCRALVPRGAGTCPDCGAPLATVRSPGVGRMVTNLLPGITAGTSLIMLVNGFWFAMMIMVQMKAGDGGGLFASFDPELNVRFGAGLSRPRVLSDGAVAGGEWWRLVTPIFLHAGILHFFFNSYLLIQLGPLVEELWGTARFWVVYLACGLAGSATSQLPRFVVTVGASGAIMGLMGLLVVHGVRHGSVLGQSMKQLLFRLVAYSLLLSLLLGGRIDHLNHVGGFAAGALLALIVPTGPFRGRAESGLWQSLSLAAVMLVLYAFYQVAAQGRLAAAL
jgi:rhomboid protease GluP